MMFRLSALLLLCSLVLVRGETVPAFEPPDPNFIPVAQDIPRPGVITIEVDATDVTRGIFQVTETIPVAKSGPLTLLYPQWLPGRHADYGDASALAGLKITAHGRPLAWRRNPVDVFAFHLDVPAGATSIEARFQFLSATAANQGRIVVTPDLLNLQWISMALYPAGHSVRQITVSPSLKLPAGWKAATALEVAAEEGPTLRYRPVSFDTLMDSPVFAGIHFRSEELAPGVRLNIVADRPEQLALTPEQLQLHRNIVIQADKLFGARHYDHYDFLLALSSQLGRIGREHHRSSENGVEGGYFTDWKASLPDHDLLPHEYTHSWNGKYRRPAELWTPDFRTPMKDSLLWVYEGQTEFWGLVLAARSGLMSKDEALGAFATFAATIEARAGRAWRPLLDTTNDPIVAHRRPKGWLSWQRSEDYYLEGMLVWLDADSLIRELSHGKSSLDDFARAFFGTNNGDWGVSTYTLADVIHTLNDVQPYNWTTFFADRVDKLTAHAPLDGFQRGGYQLVYTDKPTEYFKAFEKDRKVTDLSYSGGFILGKEGEVTAVVWDSPAFAAGLTVSSKILALNGRALDPDQLKAAIKAKQSPLQFLVKSGDVFRTVELNYDGGLRYPRLEKLAGARETGSLEVLLTPLR